MLRMLSLRSSTTPWSCTWLDYTFLIEPRPVRCSYIALSGLCRQTEVSFLGLFSKVRPKIEHCFLVGHFLMAYTIKSIWLEKPKKFPAPRYIREEETK